MRSSVASKRRPHLIYRISSTALGGRLSLDYSLPTRGDVSTNARQLARLARVAPL